LQVPVRLIRRSPQGGIRPRQRADSLLRIQKQAAIVLRMAKDCPAVGVVAGPISQPPCRKRFEMRLARYSAISETRQQVFCICTNLFRIAAKCAIFRSEAQESPEALTTKTKKRRKEKT
jgi:hypothetical protein